jgi:diguanylate cyclase (GGDEF)-like protein
VPLRVFFREVESQVEPRFTCKLCLYQFLESAPSRRVVEGSPLIDLRTIHVTAAIFACLCLYLLLIHRSTPGLRGMRFIIYGYATSAVGMELIALHDHIPQLFSVTIANCLLVLINVFVYWGIAELLHLRRPQRWLLPASLIPAVAISLYFSYVRPDVSARIIGMSLLNVAQYSLIVHLLSGPGPLRVYMPRLGLSDLFSLYSVINIYRAWEAHMRDPSALRISAVTSVFSFLTPILIAVMTALGFIWLAMAQLQHELEMQSRTDSLTGLLNRRAFEQIAAAAIEQARRQSSALSLIILDLDRFKSINDEHGHDGGDAVLHRAARCLRDNLREVDHVARLGGEEFVAVLPGTTQDRAAEIAEDLRRCLASLTVEHLSQEIHLSASFGVSTMLPTDTTWFEILRRGDRALYLAKEQGRDRVAIL